jgi:hypothetical protein
MAKTKTEETALAPIEAKQAAMAVFEGVSADDTRGTENIGTDDVRVPFLAVAQKNSKAVDKTEAAYIPGLELGQMYNSESREIYGDGPVEFLPLVMKRRAHLIIGNTGKNGEEIDWNDPRLDYDPNRDKPIARRIYDWGVMLLPSMERVIVSFYGKGFNAGQTLNRLVKLRKPAFAGKYTLSTTVEKNDAGVFGRFIVAPAGKPTADEFAIAELMYESMQTQNIVSDDSHIGAEVVNTTVVEGDEPF